MGCPVRPGGDDDESDGDRDERDASGFDRRSFMKSALLIGGTSALDTALGRFGLTGQAAAAVQSDAVLSIAERSNRQHAWDAYEQFDTEKETSVPPAYHLFLHLDYLDEGRPSETDRRTVATAFDGLESAFGWSSDGLLFTVGYSASYFDRYDEALPLGIDPESGFAKPGLLRPETLIETDGVTLPHEDPDPDGYDAVVHLASNDAALLLAAEEFLWGAAVTVGGETKTPTASLDGVFTRPTAYPARRVGFVGHENLEEMPEFEQVTTGEEDPDGLYPDDVPEDAELSMGFNDLFRNSIPRETNVTMLEEQKLVEPKPPGAFAQGTIQHVSKLDIDLDPEEGWYQYDEQERRERMFSPEHTAENTGEVGEELGNSNAPGDTPIRQLNSDEDDVAERTQEDAENRGVVGHVQKIGRARFDLNERLTETRAEETDADEEVTSDERGDPYDEDLPGHDGPQEAEQVVLRRDVDTTDEGQPGNHFVALMRFNPYMVYIRQAMNGVAFDSEAFGLTGDDRIQHDDIRDDLVDADANGIANFLETKRRGNYVVPPLRMRALPPAQAARPPMVVAPDEPGVPSLDGSEEGTVEVAVGVGDDAVDDAAMTAAAEAWRDGASAAALGDVATDYREDGQLVPDGYERDPREDQPPEYEEPKDVDPSPLGHVEFGPRYAVNAGRGAEPTDYEWRDVDGDGEDELVLTFDAADLSFDESTRYARLFAETRTGFPVFATAPVDGSDPGRNVRREVALDR